MRQLAIVLIGASILAVCNAGCLLKAPEGVKIGEEPKGCTYKGETHERDSAWKTLDCEDCWCYSDGTMKCCTAYGKPVGYDKENCKRVFDKASCSYKLIPIKDPTVKCKENGMVG